jgi:hypothetical protein
LGGIPALSSAMTSDTGDLRAASFLNNLHPFEKDGAAQNRSIALDAE